MARSITDICNHALDFIGEKHITDINATSTVAAKCKRLFQDSVDEVLREHAWNCATERRALAPTTDTPAFEYKYKFLQPNNPYCLKVRSLFNTSSRWKVEGRYILTDDSSINIIYTKRVTDPNEFDSLIAEAIALKLAMKLSYSITKEVSQGQRLIDLYRDTIERAKAIDSQEGSADEVVDTDWGEY